jgi:predicted alpha/beta hydrolase family esterase
MMPHLLIITGLNDSGQGHWQFFWLKKFFNSSKVIQDNWSKPKCEKWLKRLTESINKLDKPTILVAHSLGVSLVMHWISKYNNPNIIGALLVAPADVNSPKHTPSFLRNFAPIPLTKLSFPSIVVCSENDPYITLERAQFLSEKWGSTFINIGQKGHINSTSNLGYWDEGQQILQQLILQISTQK